MVPATNWKWLHIPVNLATTLFGLGSAPSTICQGIQEELLLLMYWVIGTQTLVLAMHPEVVLEQAPFPTPSSHTSWTFLLAQGHGKRHSCLPKSSCTPKSWKGPMLHSKPFSSSQGAIQSTQGSGGWHTGVWKSPCFQSQVCRPQS